MARKTKEQALATREQLLDAAEVVFHRKGVAKATLDDIAREAGMTRGAVYWHFANKSEVFVAMCDRVALPLQGMLDEIAAAPGVDPLGALRTNAVNALRQVGSDERTQRVFEILFFRAEWNEEVDAVKLRETETAQRCSSHLVTIFSAAKACGQLPPQVNPALAAFFFNAFMVGSFSEWLESRPFDLTESAEWLVDRAIAGLKH